MYIQYKHGRLAKRAVLHIAMEYKYGDLADSSGLLLVLLLSILLVLVLVTSIIIIISSSSNKVWRPS